MKRIITVFLLLAITASIALAQQVVFTENFDSSLSLPAGWVNLVIDDNGEPHHVFVVSGIGVGGTNALRYNVYENADTNHNLDLLSPVIENIPAGSYLTFDYRIMQTNNTTLPADMQNSQLYLYIQSGDYTQIGLINSSNHTTSADYCTVRVSLNPFVGQSLRLNWDCRANNNNFVLDIDNVKVEVSNEGGTTYAGDPDSPLSGYILPFTLYFRQSITQSIYYPSEIAGPGPIQSIGYIFTRSNNPPGESGNGGYPTQPVSVKMWMANTDLAVFGEYTPPIPCSNFTLVYDGTIPVHNPAQNTTITINLQTPFNYTGGNLAIMTLRVLDPLYYGDDNVWKCTDYPGFDRSLNFKSDGDTDYTNLAAGYPYISEWGRFYGIPNTIITVGGSGADSDHSLPVTTAVLKGNYPNPFNPSTTIAFEMACPGDVTIDVYNIKGQKVKEVVRGSYGAGRHNVVWNGDDASGRSVGSGVYFCRMTTDGYSSVKKMLLMK